VCVCVCACVCVSLCVRESLHACVCVRVCVCVWMYACLKVCMCLCGAIHQLHLHLLQYPVAVAAQLHPLVVASTDELPSSPQPTHPEYLRSVPLPTHRTCRLKPPTPWLTSFDRAPAGPTTTDGTTSFHARCRNKESCEQEHKEGKRCTRESFS